LQLHLVLLSTVSVTVTVSVTARPSVTVSYINNSITHYEYDY